MSEVRSRSFRGRFGAGSGPFGPQAGAVFWCNLRSPPQGSRGPPWAQRGRKYAKTRGRIYQFILPKVCPINPKSSVLGRFMVQQNHGIDPGRGRLELHRWAIYGCGAAELEGCMDVIRPEILDFEPELGLKLGQTRPKYPARYPQTGRQRFRTLLARLRRVSATIRNF